MRGRGGRDKAPKGDGAAAADVAGADRAQPVRAGTGKRCFGQDDPELRAAAEGPEQGADEDDLDAGQNTALFYGRSDGVLTRVQVVRIGLNLAMAAEKG